MERIEDYRKYLSVDNGRGLLFSQDDVRIMEFYGIDYCSYDSMRDLIMIVGQVLDDSYGEAEDLEEVLSHLMENHYYFEVNK